ncbi:hypothetical protein [Streptomyces sp. Tu 2975]|uniref:hypothetical protein n=1 Tax=Streptomyces sp. Tu 2975 TaxID=2676871 RepID=UPI001FC9A6AA|nr:hypothetical protein [Streptomyces sp. Tu 2975]
MPLRAAPVLVQPTQERGDPLEVAVLLQARPYAVDQPRRLDGERQHAFGERVDAAARPAVAGGPPVGGAQQFAAGARPLSPPRTRSALSTTSALTRAVSAAVSATSDGTSMTRISSVGTRGLGRTSQNGMFASSIASDSSRAAVRRR